MKYSRSSSIALAMLTGGVAVTLLAWQAPALAIATARQFIPTGVFVTPTAAPGSHFEALNPDNPADPTFTVDHAVSMAVSPDKRTLLILTSGYNSQNFTTDPKKGQPDPALSTEYVFVYDIEHGAPIKRQVLPVQNAFEGIAWNPSGLEFYVTGWVTTPSFAFAGDDVFVFGWDPVNSQWKQTATIPLGHNNALGLGTLSPAPAGLAVTADGTRLIVANYQNDSVSIVNIPGHVSLGDVDLRPGHGAAGGTYPFWIAVQGNQTAFVSSPRDREIVVLSNLATRPTITDRIHVTGQPTKLLLNADLSLLFALEANKDAVAVISTRSHKLLEEINTTAPASAFSNPHGFKGSNPTGFALSPDEDRLYVTNGGANSVAVIELGHPRRDREGGDDENRHTGDENPHSNLVGLIPTGWYPNAVSLNRDGSTLYIVNGKSNTGPVPKACRDKGSLAIGDGVPASSEINCSAANQYVWQLTKAGFLTMPVPGEEALEELTAQVAKNNGYGQHINEADERVMAYLRAHVQHIIYIVKENRTYDQILGDLPVGNGDPALTVYPQPVTPNQHALAGRFVDLDNFFDSGEVSGDGWNWSTSAQAADTIEKTEPINYAGRGLNYDFEGTNRNINVAHATVAERQAANPISPSDPDILAGSRDVSEPDSPDGDEGAGYLWDAAIRSGKSVRNYGFFLDLVRYSLPPGPPFFGISPDITDPFGAGIAVAFPTKAALVPLTDPYFRGYDNKFPDFFRVREWAREFDQFERDGQLPNLEFIRVMHDHTGSFGTATFGLVTPTIQTADNDYAVGLIVDRVSHSPRYKDNTLIFVVEDDSQDGPDHVDAHRSVAFVAGAYVGRNVVVSKAYTTVNLVRTIVDVLGIDHFNLNEASSLPMTDVFGRTAVPWAFNAIVPHVLRSSSLPLPPASVVRQGSPDALVAALARRPDHDATYWEERTRGFDFAAEDRVDAARYNEILWTGIMGENVPYPAGRSGADLRRNRKALLKAWLRSLQQASAR